MADRTTIDGARAVVGALVGAALFAAIWLQRATIGDALAEARSMSFAVVAILLALGVAERVSRAEIVRRLLGTISFRRSLTIHDVGAAASKGLPFGGPLATALRWTIARDAAVPTTHFTSMLVACGVASTFVTWLLPSAVLAIDMTGRSATSTDVAMLAVSTIVIGASVIFWTVVLRSDRVTAWVVAVARRVIARLGRVWTASARVDPGAAILEVRSSLRAVGQRPFGLLGRTAVAQMIGAVILLVALRGLGVGSELGVVEFARVYFVVTLLSSFVPVPGGVGVIETGLTAALVAAGVDASTALAGVLVYRLFTYVVPIVVGAVLYAAWRFDVRRREPEMAWTAPTERREPAILE